MNLYSQIASNKRRTWLLVALFVAFIAFLGYIFSEVTGYGISGFSIAVIISILMALGSYYYSDKMVLAISGAREVQHEENPELFHIVENLCIGSGLPMPKIYLINDPSPNAFATGRDPKHAAVAVTTGLLSRLERAELEGVLAHELSHVKNFDMRLMTITVVMVGVIALMSDWLLRFTFWGGRSRDDREGGNQIQVIILFIGLALAILAPLIANLIKLAISRKREFLADASAAYITRYPAALAEALEKISADSHQLHSATNATAHLFIVNPFKNKNWLNNLFSTHPAIEERIAALRAM